MPFTPANITITGVTIPNILDDATIVIENVLVTISGSSAGNGTWLSDNVFTITLFGTIFVATSFTESPNNVTFVTLASAPTDAGVVTKYISDTNNFLSTQDPVQSLPESEWTGILQSTTVDETPVVETPVVETPVVDPITNNNAISNICFVANTPIVTDQGEIAIDKINPNIHTIVNKKIVGITKTISIDDNLICFEKDAICYNVPSRMTIMTQDHKILYKGKMMQAKDFASKYGNLNGSNKVYKVKYNGECLYNVVMETHSKIMVNNLICETLHPKNTMAVLHKTLQIVNKAQKLNIIKFINKNAEKIYNRKFGLQQK